MKSHSIVSWVILLISLAFVSCGSVKEPEFRGIENIRIKSFGLKESTLNLNLHYFNPNKSRLSLKKAEGDAWIDGKLLGHFIVDTLVQIPAEGDFQLPVNLKMDMGSAFKNSLNAFFNKEVMVKIDGRAKVGKAGIYIHYPIRYEGKQNFGEMIRENQTNRQ
jgi:LEA14-like dessication related protein